MKPSLIIRGAAGRMGKRLLALTAEGGKFRLLAAVEACGHAEIGKDAGIVAGIGNLGLDITAKCPPGGDVMLDFSYAAATETSVDYCLANNCALVIGTTGLEDKQNKAIAAAAGKIAIVKASNMSIGMNLLFRLAPVVAQALGDDYDIEIVESHHRFKKDAPSGSALTIAGNIAARTGRAWPDCLVESRAGRNCLRRKGDIGVHAVRAGAIVGQHNIIFSTMGETVVISHSADSRDTFAAGALRAAEWVIGKGAGLYSMADVLNIEFE